MTKSCEYCKYYFKDECRRYPPERTIINQINSSAFPLVSKDKWCGEFSYKDTLLSE